MGKLKPIGSEKLEGIQKLSRIMEIARYKENIPNPINETTSNNYNIKLSDGNIYHINKEKNGYVITRTLSEGRTEYVEPMKNRKYYNSYSQAFKRLNLIAKEVNILTGNEQGISLFSEQKKFVLKTPNQPAEEPVSSAPVAPAPTPEAPAPATEAPAPTPESEPSSAPAPAPEGDMEEPDMESPEMEEPEGDMESPEMEEPEGDETEGEGIVSFKTIQKLTGKLGQKLRKLNQGEEPISADDTKYVINSILSALDLSVLSDEDMEEIIGRLEDSEFEGEETEEPDMEEPEMEEPEMEEPEMEEPEMEEPEGEMTEEDMNEYIEGMIGKGEYDLGFKKEPKEMNFDNYVKNRFSSAMNDAIGTEMKEEDGIKKIFDGVFSESKVDNIIKSYFVETETEKKFLQEQKNKKFLSEKAKKMKIMKEVERLSESFRQESTSSKFLDRYSKADFIGKTNKKNLIFEVNGKQYKITPDGAIL